MIVTVIFASPRTGVANDLTFTIDRTDGACFVAIQGAEIPHGAVLPKKRVCNMKALVEERVRYGSWQVRIAYDFPGIIDCICRSIGASQCSQILHRSGAVPKEGMVHLISRQIRRPYDLTEIVEAALEVRQCGTGQCASEGAQVDHSLHRIPQECVSGRHTGRGVDGLVSIGSPCDLSRIIDEIRPGVWPSQGSEILHNPIRPQEGPR